MTDREAKVKGIIQARKMQPRRLQDAMVPHWEAKGFGTVTLIFSPPPNWLRRKLAGWMYGFHYIWGAQHWGVDFQYHYVWWCHCVAGCRVAYERIQ